MAGNLSTQKTEGTLVLKIARLERHLKAMEKQQALGGGYDESTKEQLQVQYQLNQLQQLLDYRR